jgi:hypothetical protein
MTLRGSCHCGNVSFELETSTAAAELPLRTCQCSFCRRHGARNTSDPAGRLTVVVADPAALSRYRFGLGITEFLVCGTCGIYVVATMVDGERLLATVNVNTMDDAAAFDRPPTPRHYDAESADVRLARRREAWTPAAVVVRGASGGTRGHDPK